MIMLRPRSRQQQSALSFVFTGPTIVHAFATILTCINILPLVFAEDASYSCSDYNNCGDCSSSTYCHWCASDEACHTYGSWYGCTYGVDCDSIDQCMRDEPEKRGYTWKGIAGLMGFGFVAMGLFLWKFSSSNAAKNATATSDLEYDMPVTPYQYQKSEMRGGGGQESMQTAHIIAPVSLVQSPSSLTVSQAILSVSVAVALVLVIVLVPKLPQINICSTEFDWDSILEGLQQGYFQTSVVSLISIYNPSLYAVYIHTLEASFRHEGLEFGTVSMDPVVISSQSITDNLVTVTFKPENSQVIYNLLSAYALSNLNITVDVQMEGTFPSLSNKPYRKDFNGIFLDLSDDVTDDDGADDDGGSGGSARSNSYMEDKHLCSCSYRRLLLSQFLDERKLQEITPFTIDDL